MPLLGFTQNLHCVYFSDAINGWVVGDGGSILRTTNGGAVWAPQSSGTLVNLYSVHFTDANNGWAVGGSQFIPGIILHSSNGGAVWNVQPNPPGYDWASFHSVYFVDSNTGWAAGNVIAHTANGGNTWVVQPLSSSSSLWFLSVHFTDASNGWAVGGEYFQLENSASICYYTSNGGNTWTEQIELKQWSGMDYPYPSSVYFSDANNGWLVGSYGTILHTTNGGLTFVEPRRTSEVPTNFVLGQNYPNPFNPTTTINYQLPTVKHVTLKLFDILGREVAKLVNEVQVAGFKSVKWDASGVASGVYLYRLQAGEFVETKKLLVLR